MREMYRDVVVLIDDGTEMLRVEDGRKHVLCNDFRVLVQDLVSRGNQLL
jgi:hypothetical protein